MILASEHKQARKGVFVSSAGYLGCRTNRLRGLADVYWSKGGDLWMRKAGRHPASGGTKKWRREKRIKVSGERDRFSNLNHERWNLPVSINRWQRGARSIRCRWSPLSNATSPLFSLCPLRRRRATRRACCTASLWKHLVRAYQTSEAAR